MVSQDKTEQKKSQCRFAADSPTSLKTEKITNFRNFSACDF